MKEESGLGFDPAFQIRRLLLLNELISMRRLLTSTNQPETSQTMNENVTIRTATTNDIPVIQMLAHKIWPDAYAEILKPDQLAYMLDFIYSPASLQRQMNEQQHQFLLTHIGEEPVGFAAYSKIAEPGTYKLHKLYVRTDIQGKGLGKALLDTVISDVKKLNGTHLHLNVNRFNKARFFYEKLGFQIIREEDVDIGNGYFMIDYVMEKPLM